MMNSKRFQRVLRIQLESDLCTASGEGFSSGIDMDVCYDDRGLPFIPARRIKGCLRAAALEALAEPHGINESFSSDGFALELQQNENLKPFNDLFGKSGSAVGGTLRICDAQLTYSNRPDASVEENLERFTYTRAQTAINEEGYADENTLRFLRVVKQYDPITKKKNVFESLVSCSDEAQCGVLEMACKALRNIGYGRNRGLGAISCTLEDPGPSGRESNIVNLGGLSGQSAETWRIDYSVRLDSPLMLPQQSGTESIDYVPGTSVLGYFASQLSDYDDFDELFLKERVRFSPLYPIGPNGIRCVPAPPFIVKLKGGEHDGEYRSAWAAKGLVGKPLKSGFVDSNYYPVKVRREILYHHSRQGNGMLYTQDCLSPGQIFCGFIEGAPQNLKPLAKVLEGAGPQGLSFGRSKTAQYAGCTLLEARAHRVSKSVVKLEKNKTYVFLLDSDVLIGDGLGRLSTNHDDLVAAILKAAGIDDAEACEFDIQASLNAEAYPPISTNLKYHTVTGYNSKWNQKRPHVRVFSAGSCLAFSAKVDIDSLPSEFLIGERVQEGLGRVLLLRADDVAYEVSPCEQFPGDSGKVAPGEPDVPAAESVGFENEGALSEDERVAVIKYAQDIRWKFNAKGMNASFVSRLTRMAKEARSCDDFIDRISSIKTKRKCEEAADIYKGLMNQKIDFSCWPRKQEALILLFTFGKYFIKQTSNQPSKI